MRRRRDAHRGRLLAQLLGLAVALAAHGTASLSQTVVVGTTSLTFASPNRAAYVAAVSALVSTTAGYTCPSTGTASKGCRLHAAVGTAPAQPLGVVQMQLASVASTGGAACSGTAPFNVTTAWVTLTATAQTVLTSPDNGGSCTGTVRFRVATLSWTTYVSLSAVATEYTRGVVVTATREP
jgi:hypothetical protein